jgi:hypothetical protein
MSKWTLEFCVGFPDWLPISLNAKIDYQGAPKGISRQERVVEKSWLMSGSAIIHYAVVECADGSGKLLVKGDEARYRRDAAFRSGVDHLRRRLAVRP